jgi:uncharacterized secreted protein with C-terminal beta-propeller domain
MKNKAEIIFGLLAIGILVIAFKDKIFKKKEDSTIEGFPILDITNNKKLRNIEIEAGNVTQYLSLEEYAALKKAIENRGDGVDKIGEIFKTDIGSFQMKVIQIDGITKGVQWVRI